MPQPFSQTVNIPDTINPNDTWGQLSYVLKRQAGKSPVAAAAILEGLQNLVQIADGIIGKPESVRVRVSYPGYEAITVSDGRSDHQVPCNCESEVSPQVFQLLKGREAELKQVQFAGSQITVSVLG